MSQENFGVHRRKCLFAIGLGLIVDRTLLRCEKVAPGALTMRDLVKGTCGACSSDLTSTGQSCKRPHRRRIRILLAAALIVAPVCVMWWLNYSSIPDTGAVPFHCVARAPRFVGQCITQTQGLVRRILDHPKQLSILTVTLWAVAAIYFARNPRKV